MLAEFVPDVLTPFSFEEAAEAMEQALYNVLPGGTVPRTVLALALSKSALETGRWKKIHCNNWGNVKAGTTYRGMYTAFLLNEILNGKIVWFAPEGQLAGGPGTALVGQRWEVPPGHPQTRMRAYANRFDGAYSYVEFVAGGRYAKAWQELLKGNPAGYSKALKAAGYYTADEALYTKGVVGLFNEFEGKLAGRTVPEYEIDDDAQDLARLVLAGEQAIDDLAVLVRDDRRRAMRDAGLTDEERERLGYHDTDRSPPPTEDENA